MHHVPIGYYPVNRATAALQAQDRLKHMAIFGKTGVGKTTLLANMIAADLKYGAGVTVVDPHGSLIADILETLPSERTNDVIYLNPLHHSGRVVGLNLLDVKQAQHKPLVVSSLISIFKNLWPEGWGARSEFIFSNALYALLALPYPSTLLAVQKLLTDQRHRRQLLGRIRDPSVLWFFNQYDKQWSKSFREEAIAPIVNKVNKFVASPLLRPVLGQPRSGFDFRALLDERKILLCDLSKGTLGFDVSSLLGSIVVTKLALAALSRRDIPEHEREAHFLYADEVQNFVYGMDLPTIVAEARKYRLALTMATQTLGQLPKDTQSAVLGNCGTIAAFRLSAADALVLEQEFLQSPPAREFISLNDYEMYVKTLIDGGQGEPTLVKTYGPAPEDQRQNRSEVIIRTSLERYGQPRAAIEAKLKAFFSLRD
jgi:type IV secretory pathway TraG/TraD family ATPase VirD4